MSKTNPYILTNISAIVNRENTDRSRNLQDIEQRMVNNGIITSEETSDPADILYDDLSTISQRAGINFENIEPRKKPTPIVEDESVEEVSTPATSTTIWPEESANRFSNGESNLFTRTKEQERRQHISKVIGDSNDELGFDEARLEDMRSNMITEIDELMALLLGEGADVSRVPVIDEESTTAQVEQVLKLLRRKNDTTRYCSFAEEFMIFGAHTMEELFDGKRTWFGYYRPNLVGWHNHVEVKLKRMRYDTRQIVSNVMQELQISPLFRILLELVPNMILYSKMKTQQRNVHDRTFDEETAEATRRLDDNV